MAFKNLYNAECDHDGCSEVVTVWARTATHANQEVLKQGWKVGRSGRGGGVRDEDWRHWCPLHKKGAPSNDEEGNDAEF